MKRVTKQLIAAGALATAAATGVATAGPVSAKGVIPISVRIPAHQSWSSRPWSQPAGVTTIALRCSATTSAPTLSVAVVGATHTWKYTARCYGTAQPLRANLPAGTYHLTLLNTTAVPVTVTGQITIA
jgi:hypothetical protein